MGDITPEELEEISREAKKDVDVREGDARVKIVVHMGTCGIAAGAREISSTLMDEVEERSLDDVAVTISSCAGLCSREPMITVKTAEDPPVKYVDLSPEKAVEILEKHVVGGEIVETYALSVGSERTL